MNLVTAFNPFAILIIKAKIWSVENFGYPHPVEKRSDLSNDILVYM